MAKSFRAVYRDSHNRTYSCPVVKIDGQWQMVTSEGSGPITAQFQDDVAGPLIFDSYREVESDQLHVTPGTNWSGHKQAFAEQRLAEERKQRDQARAEIQNVPVDPVAVANARAANEYAAAVKRPRGGGTGVAADIPQITHAEIAMALRNKR